MITKRKLFFMIIALSLFTMIWGCGENGYDTPSTTSTDTVISAEKVKKYVDSGKVNGSGFDKVVILDVSTASTYGAGHIPGAIFVDHSDIIQTRSEGVIPAVNMVLNGSAMDALIKKYGITRNTTVIFTGPGTSAAHYLWTGRAYFLFRYWGFPKERLKVIDGLNGAYDAKYGLKSGSSPTVASSTYSVQKNAMFRKDLRVSLQEMIDVADGKKKGVLVIDGRGGDGPGGGTYSYDGDPLKTTGVFSAVTGDYVAFEGHVRGAAAMSWSDLFRGIDYDNDTVIDYYRFAKEGDMTSLLNGIGLNSNKTAYVHCRTAIISSGMFVALDAFLGWPVANYDGSWSQWGQLAGVVNGGYLDDNSPWRTDTPERTEELTLNIDYGATIEDPASGGTVNYFDTSANRIEEEDEAYFGSGSGGGGGGGGEPPVVGC
jgi:3-mercaptopyruvate sulfurtransferase SseA